MPAARPPRSHSQIRFTLQPTPAPQPHQPCRPARERCPRLQPRHGHRPSRNQTSASPNLASPPAQATPPKATPPISAPPLRCKPARQWRADPGGGERDRTDDLLLAKQALSQLSYTPGQEADIAKPGSHPCDLRSAGLRHWWAREDLNLRPHAYQARALTS
jgi:hypothetical protein